MPSLHYVRKDGVTYDINGDVLAQKANIDGYYENLGSGLADQLRSDTYETDSVPYQFRTSGGSLDIGDREVDEIVGGTVAWNQLVQAVNAGSTVYGITRTRNADATKLTYTGTAESSTNYTAAGIAADELISGHKYYVSLNANLPAGTRLSLTDVDRKDSGIFALAQMGFGLFINSGTTVDVTVTPQVTDLTLALGTTIADYVYSLEQGTAGTGVAWLKSHFPRMFDQYNAYEPGRLEPVSGVSAHEMTGFNQSNEEWIKGYWWANGEWTQKNNSFAGMANRIQCLPNTQYEITFPNITKQYGLYRRFWDADGNYFANSYGGVYVNPTTKSLTLTTPSNCYGLAFDVFTDTSGGAVLSDLQTYCIHLRWDGSRDGEYEPYVKHSYALDPDVTLYGVPYLDENNKLQYNGDIYHSDGTIDRRFGVVDLGTLTWTYNSSSTRFESQVPTAKQISSGSTIPNAKCSKYEVVAFSSIFAPGADKLLAFDSNYLRVKDSGYTDAAAFKTAMSGVYLVYELATPTTEQATPYTNPQIVDDFGTEEYVTDSIVPVGHVTQYQPDLKAKLEMAPDSPSGDGDYIVRQTGGMNTYVPLSSSAVITGLIARIEALEAAISNE